MYNPINMNTQVHNSLVKRIMLLIVLFLSCCKIFAYDFEVNGLYYNILSNNQVEVTYKKMNDMSYSGRLSIPERIKYMGKEYIVTSIGDWAFWYCEGLTGSLNLPNTITTIGNSAFQECKNLTGELIIPNSVKTIGTSAFAGCTGFRGSLNIPSSVTKIGSCAFGSCKSFTGTLTIPNSVVTIEESAFIGCSGFTGSLKLPNSLTEIADWVFYNCSGFTGTLTIPNSVKSIGKNAFSRCEGITGSLIIPNSVTDIGENAFGSCKGFSGALVIPNSVKSIGGESFWNCYGFSGTLTIPNSVITIGGCAFSGCKGFSGPLVIPNSVTIIENGVFSGCEGLESLTIHDRVKSIKEYAFKDCKGLTGTLTIPGSVQSIDNGAFTNCSSLNTLSISNGVTSIGNNAFKYCSGLTSVIIPNSVISVGISAFESCWKLTKLVIPKGVNSIGYSAFQSCSSLKLVESNIMNPYNIDNRVFKGISSTAKLMVPKGTRSKYEVLSGWTNNFSEISEIGSTTTYTLSIIAIGNGSASYSGSTIRSKTSSFTVNEGTSATITFLPDNGYRIKNVEVNNSTVSVSNNQYTISSINTNTTVSVEFEAIPPTTYTLSITTSGNGSASYNGTTFRGKTNIFTVNEGTSAMITFTPDAGYQIKTVKVNGSAVSISNNGYTISCISKNTTVEVEFEKVPADSEGGYNTYLTCINKTAAMFSVGSSVQKTVYFEIMNSGNKSIFITKLIAKNPDTNSVLLTSTDTSVLGELEGGKTKSLSIKLYQDVWPIYEITYTIDNKEYTYDNTRYKILSITGNKFGSVKFLEASIGVDDGKFSVKSGDDATLEFVPGEGCVLSKVTVNDIEITSNIVDNKYIISNITSSTSVNAVFDGVSGNSKSINGHEYVDLGLPSGKYWATENYGANKPEEAGSYLSYDNLSNVSKNWGEYWRLPTKAEMQELLDECEWTWTELNGTSGFVIKGPNGNTLFLPAAGMRSGTTTSSFGTIAFYYTSDYERFWYYWMFEGSSSNKTISNKPALVDEYPVRPISTVKNESVFSVDGLNFSVISSSENTANLAKGNYGKVLDVPTTVKYPSVEWKIVGIDKGALSECDSLAAVIWNPEVVFTENVNNPNLLLYVKSASYAPTSVKNVVVNGIANNIVLSDASGKNDFFCPKEFTAQKVSYTHHYTMETGLGNARGWETIALPFDVQKITHQSKGEIVPFANWKSGDIKKPFWLMTYGTSGWVDANSIKANTPYIISMPNHSYYKPEFLLNGNVTFLSENVSISTSENFHTTNYNGKTFIPNYSNQSDNNYYALNVNNDYVTYSGNKVEGSEFLIGRDNPRIIRPFEAYMTSASQTRSYIAIGDDMTTSIGDVTEILADEKIVRVYNLNGQLIMAEYNKSMDEIKALLSAGVYIVNGKLLIIK